MNLRIKVLGLGTTIETHDVHHIEKLPSGNLGVTTIEGGHRRVICPEDVIGIERIQ